MLDRLNIYYNYHRVCHLKRAKHVKAFNNDPIYFRAISNSDLLTKMSMNFRVP